MLITIIAFLFVLGLVIMVHELGHFIFAKRAGILCHEFALGMGPTVYNKRKGETVYAIRAIPFGGFVSMAGEGAGIYIKQGQKIGLILENNIIKEIIINECKNAEIMGSVHDFELYGENGEELFIAINTEDGLKSFVCDKEAKFMFPKKKQIQIAPFERCFEAKNKRERFLAIFMGPAMNFILAFILFMLVTLFTGIPNLSSSKVGKVSDLSGNETIIKKNDELKEIFDGISWRPVSSWTDFSEAMKDLNTKQEIKVKVKRNNQTEELILHNTIFINSAGLGSSKNKTAAELGYVFGKAQKSGLEVGMIVEKIKIAENEIIINNFEDLAREFEKLDIAEVTIFTKGGKAEGIKIETFGNQVLNNQDIIKVDSKVGISPTYKFSLMATLTAGFKGIYRNVIQIFKTLGLVFGTNKQVSVGDLSGPIGIFAMIQSYVNQGFWPLIAFAAFLSVNVGLLNLLPIPAFDGGRLLFLGIEAVSKKKVNKNVENLIHTVMFFLLMGFMIFITIKDVFRFF